MILLLYRPSGCSGCASVGRTPQPSSRSTSEQCLPVRTSWQLAHGPHQACTQCLCRMTQHRELVQQRSAALAQEEAKRKFRVSPSSGLALHNCLWLQPGNGTSSNFRAPAEFAGQSSQCNASITRLMGSCQAYRPEM